jgi:hypothetical protein
MPLEVVGKLKGTSPLGGRDDIDGNEIADGVEGKIVVCRWLS